MAVVGTRITELILNYPEGNATASGVVAPGHLEALENARTEYGVTTIWLKSTDPNTGESREAFTPLAEGRLQLILERGIQHGDRFRATIHFKEESYQGGIRVKMFLDDPQPIPPTA